MQPEHFLIKFRKEVPLQIYNDKGKEQDEIDMGLVKVAD